MDISYITYQCARFCSNPKEIHTKALRWFGRYLMKTANKGYIIKPVLEKGLQVYVDSDWMGNWDTKEPETYIDTARSRYRFIIMFAGVPIF